MARDGTELAGMYRNAARDKFIVASSGTLTVESGGVIDVLSGGVLKIQAGGILSSSGSLSMDSLAVTSTGTFTNNGTISNKGTLSSTGAVTISNTLTLGKASATTISTGATVASSGTLNCKTVNFTKTSTITLSTGGTLNSSGTATFKNLTLRATGTMLLTTGATVTFGANIANKGTITNSSDGQIRESVQSAVAAVALNAYGVSVIGSSTVGARTYTLARPAGAGIRKTIICKGSTGACLVRCSSLAKLDYGTNRKITFSVNADGYGVELIATSSTNWQTIRNSTAQVTTIVYGST